VVAQAVQHLSKRRNLKMQARRRLVEDEERAAGIALRKLERELNRCASPPESGSRLPSAM
jgi:hypothetical protein